MKTDEPEPLPAPSWLARWRRLDRDTQQCAVDRLKAQPILLKRPLRKRILWVPVIFWRQWQIGRKYMTEWNAFRYAFMWTRFFIFGANNALSESHEFPPQK